MTARDIPGGPLYPRDEVLSLLAGRGKEAVIPWTRKCIGDIQKLGFDSDEVFDLVNEAVSCGRFTGPEWCERRPNGPWAACDAYELSRWEWSDVANKDIEYIYYIKIAIGMTGKVLLLVSCHLSN